MPGLGKGGAVYVRIDNRQKRGWREFIKQNVRGKMAVFHENKGPGVESVTRRIARRQLRPCSPPDEFATESSNLNIRSMTC